VLPGDGGGDQECCAFCESSRPWTRKAQAKALPRWKEALPHFPENGFAGCPGTCLAIAALQGYGLHQHLLLL